MAWIERTAAPILAAAMVAAAFGAQGKTEGGKRPESFTLSNGLEVIVIEDHRAPVVTHMVWYKVGAADETPGKSGIAHFLEHLLFKGTPKNPKGAIDKIISRAGGEHNAFTSQDVTVYHQQVPKARLPLMMQLEADRMVNLVLSDAEVTSERQVILEERNQSVDNHPSRILSEQVAAALYTNHRYGVPVLGWRREMEGLNRADAESFYRRHYAPNNAILVVAGDVTAAEVKPMAEAAYGPLPRGDVPARDRAGEPEPRSERRVVLKDPRVTQTQWGRSYLAPSYRTGEKGEGYALDLLAHLLGGGSTSLMYRTLVEEQKLAVSISVSYEGGVLDTTEFSIDATPAPGVSLDRLEAGIDAALKRFLKDGVNEKDLARAKTQFVAAAIFARDDQSAQARIYGSGRTTGMTIDDIFNWHEVIKATPKGAIEAVAKKILKAERSVTARLEPASVAAVPAPQKKAQRK